MKRCEGVKETMTARRGEEVEEDGEEDEEE